MPTAHTLVARCLLFKFRHLKMRFRLKMPKFYDFLRFKHRNSHFLAIGGSGITQSVPKWSKNPSTVISSCSGIIYPYSALGRYLFLRKKFFGGQNLTIRAAVREVERDGVGSIVSQVMPRVNTQVARCPLF